MKSKRRNFGHRVKVAFYCKQGKYNFKFTTKEELCDNFSQCFNLKYQKYTCLFFSILSSFPYLHISCGTSCGPANVTCHLLSYSQQCLTLVDAGKSLQDLGHLATIHWKETESKTENGVLKT